jgi:hypothetical protein
VADGGDDGDLRGGDGARQGFVVERCEIFGRTAAAGDDDYVDIVVLIEEAEAGGDFLRRGLALNLRGIDKDVNRVVTALEYVENIAERGGVGRGDYANARRQGGDRFFALGGEQAFGFEFGLELFEGLWARCVRQKSGARRDLRIR